ncbi:MAG: MotA/TolQ/ExbB proton channel family protein [Crocinitomicaceae bacterium]|jgi:biopolymer transport protein ExbB|nr:MotA/TolQ/ExbB proton channel family protein [Crocinitomicaceae bacterium]MBP6033590.1 MotA/TolQ/ExbB proton channel family protein [Crocinitomicaceae bacterium]
MNKNKKTAGGFSAIVSFLAIAIALVAGALIYSKVFGDPSNFVDNDPTGEPMEGNLYGVIYKGGFIVPILVAINLIIIIFSIERLVTLLMANGKGNTDKFIAAIKGHMEKKDYKAAIAQCDKQKGSLANVVRAGLEKYEHINGDSSLTKEQKLESLKKELEEATSLELPMLSKNLAVLSTSASVATLIGLIGTVLGMIRSFAAMSKGSPDTAALATGISEALINTAFGITASTLAIILYNFFSTKIDTMTYSIDEASFTIVQDFSSTN